MSDNLSEYGIFEISSHTGLKLSLQRRPRLSNDFNDVPSPSLSPSGQPARKRQRLSAVLLADLSPSSFRPVLTSTVNLQQHNVFCPPRPIENTVDNTLVSHNVSQVSSDSRLETTEEHVDNVIESVTDTSAEDSGPSWGETPVGVHPSAEESVIDPVPRCHLELYNQQEPYYYRTIAPKKALYALCQETERNNIMTYNRDMMSYTCLDIDACDEFDE